MNIKIDKKPIAITLIVVGFLFTLKFLFPFYKVESDSMSKILSKGEIVILNKLVDVKVNDIVVYRSNDKLYISRVVGKPDDKLKCIDGKLMVNDKLFESGNEVYEFLVYCKPSVNDSLINEFEELYPKREYRAVISQDEADSLRVREAMIKVEKVVQPIKLISTVFKDYSNKYWSRDNFGPIKVPDNSFWLINDNRVNINDSRSFNVVSKDDIVGKVVYNFN